uniref:Globin family profile domain-containing protein n=1 Tax=Panagrolaimus sp. PS1159 TaxID=55785 RepID=A0AC35GQP0_9BILA
MGSQQSTPQLTLAEKRYRIGSPEKIKKRKIPQKPKKKISNGNDIIESGLSIPNSKIRSKSNSNYSLSRSNTIDSRGTSSRSSSDLNSLSLSVYSINGTNNNELLSRPQRILIENSWKRSRKSGADNVGTKIFLLVLTAQPDIKMIFGLEKIPQGRLKYDPRFRKHAVVFNRTFDYIVKNLNYTEKLVQHFQALGKKHVMFQGRGFLPQYWDTFAECMTQTAIEWEGGQRCRETMIAWRTLVSFIIKQMRQGFDEEKQNRRKFPSLAPPTPSTCITPTTNFSSVKQTISSSTSTSSACQFPSYSFECPTKLIKRAESHQQFLKPEEYFEMHKLSFQDLRINENDNFDDSHSECSFYTPPTTKKGISSSFSGLSLKDNSSESSDTELHSEEIWASPRRNFSLKALHLIDPS